MSLRRFFVFVFVFLADLKIVSSWKNCILVHEHEQQIIETNQIHSDYGPPKMSLNLAV